MRLATVAGTIGLILLGASAELQAAPAQGATSTCAPADTRLCLQGSRFAVEVSWHNFTGGSGVGRAVPLTGDTGYFWFFSASNVELVLKVLDGRGLNQHFWVFYGALSTVEYTITVTDTVTGAKKEYHNAPNNLASVADTSAFPGTTLATGAPGATEEALPAIPGGFRPEPSPEGQVRSQGAAEPADTSPCAPGPATLCLNGGRFAVTAVWEDGTGRTGFGTAVPLTSDTGYFWFFRASNVELVTKVLDGTALNSHYWVFFGALSDVRYTLTVRDTRTGYRASYTNPAHTLASLADTSALPAAGQAPPTTAERIVTAFTAGQVTMDQAARYLVYSAFGDPGVPASLKGVLDAGRDGAQLAFVTQHWNELSAQTKALLLPYSKLPADPGSWYSQYLARTQQVGPGAAIDWQTRTVGNVKIWYHSDAGGILAGNIAREMSRILSGITASLGQGVGLPSDAGAPGPHGGDGKYDIYIVSKPDAWPGQTCAYPSVPQFDCRGFLAGGPSYVEVNLAVKPAEQVSTAAHELFHGAELGMGVVDSWLWEASASWFELKLFGANDSLRKAAANFQSSPGVNLFQRDEYGSYLWLAYLVSRSGDSVVGALHQAVQSGSTDEAAALSVLGAQFDPYWHEFAREELNRSPRTLFQSFGTQAVGPVPEPIEVSDGISASASSAQPLASGSVAFLPPSAGGKVKISVQEGSGQQVTAFVTDAHGVRTERAWSGGSVEFCQDRVAESFSGLDLVLSNGPNTSAPTTTVTFATEATCCEDEGGDEDRDGVCDLDPDECPTGDQDGDGVCDASACNGLGGDTDGDGTCDFEDSCLMHNGVCEVFFETFDVPHFAVEHPRPAPLVLAKTCKNWDDSACDASLCPAQPNTDLDGIVGRDYIQPAHDFGNCGFANGGCVLFGAQCGGVWEGGEGSSSYEASGITSTESFDAGSTTHRVEEYSGSLGEDLSAYSGIKYRDASRYEWTTDLREGTTNYSFDVDFDYYLKENEFDLHPSVQCIYRLRYQYVRSGVESAGPPVISRSSRIPRASCPEWAQ